SLDVQHALDPVSRTLYLGDGERFSAASLGKSLGDIITTVAGNPNGPGGDGGPATAARLDNPTGVAVGPDGSIYIAGGRRIRRAGPDGTIPPSAGPGLVGFSGDGGPAAAAQLGAPRGVAVGPDGAIYIADSTNNRIRRVGRDGIISTVAGNGTAGFGGDG